MTHGLVPSVILVGALGVAVLAVASVARARPSPLSEPDDNAPPGVDVLALGQFAVSPSLRWLLIPPGGF